MWAVTNRQIVTNRFLVLTNRSSGKDGSSGVKKHAIHIIKIRKNIKSDHRSKLFFGHQTKHMFSMRSNIEIGPRSISTKKRFLSKI